ncbi:GDPD-domain-containing protein [Hesseltinella vesiculosa]|uniref:GDPD-domain-containing protein n=1 Tax=Hesseltinella vesiculosa TaxID=101127 RepID=A0A1X2GTJ0_9FUNG|nr:GDPD-domain-containing protein [Hesseltinella vesiculosa]
MKFGKTLLTNQIAEWSKNYLAYKQLKKSIGEATHQLPPSSETTTAIFFQLDRELEKVDTFYAYKQAQLDRRLWILTEKYQQYEDSLGAPGNDVNAEEHQSSATSTCTDISDELISALQETRAQGSKLMRFGELNAKGFRKILKKLDKKLGLQTQAVYWETKIADLPFANHGSVRREMDKLAQWIGKLSGTDRMNGAPETSNHPASVSAKLTLPSKISRHNLLSDVQNQAFASIVEQDDAAALDTLLSEPTPLGLKSVHEVNTTKYGLLELTTQHGSTKCMEYLLKSGIDPMDYHDINDRNILHKFSLHADQLNARALAGIDHLLKLASRLTTQADFAGRRPLHYAAERASPVFATLLLKHALIHHEYLPNKGFAAQDWKDREGHNPLFLAILQGHADTVRALIDIGNITNIDQDIAAASTSSTSTATSESDFTLSSHHPSSVAVAAELKNLPLLKLLIEKGASVNACDDEGETALLVATRRGFTSGVGVLIDLGHADVDLSEKVNGMTPLMVAAIEGNSEIVQLLLDGGADKSRKDANGWKAFEHAVFRGFLDIGRVTREQEPVVTNGIQLNPSLSGSPLDTNASTTPTTPSSSTPSVSASSPTERSPSAGKSKSLARPERLYGHKYLTDQCMIIVTLGSNDVRSQLSQCFLNLKGKLVEEDQRLSIAVSATNATGEFPILDLPPNNQHHLLHPEPIVLFATHPEDVVIRFDLIETFAPSTTDSLLARGTAMLSSDQIFSRTQAFKGKASGNSSLRGQQTVPLIRSSTLEFVGSLGFEYFVITPFAHPRMTVGDRYTYYKSVDTKVIGHRGSGMNRKGSKLQVGENTVLSFITAASLGAEYVEFDVQLTKDLVPVIYHDWTVTETGFDIPLNAITSEQFLNLRPSGHIKEYHMGISNDGHGEIIPTINIEQPSALDTTGFLPIAKRVGRSNSVSAINGAPKLNRDDTSRMALTRSTKLGKLKGNGPETIQAPFTTLAETLKRVPKSAGCNIEVKYPMVDEAEDDELHLFQELNIFVDTILECVYNNTEEDRRIIFSSFHPEICLALNLKQPNYPVFFLTDAGTFPMADVRCNSLQGALRFAKQADLLGIVAASEPILEAPRMVSIIKEAGLLMFTYGVLNNEVKNAVAQKSYGVDAVIVDSVLAVRKGLLGDA